MLSRELAAHGTTRAVVVLSKNSNVATGDEGLRNAREIVDRVATHYDMSPRDLVIASTGVIGRQYPMNKIRAGLETLGDVAITTDDNRQVTLFT